MKIAIEIMLYTTLLTVIVAFAVSGAIVLLNKLIQFSPDEEDNSAAMAAVKPEDDDAELAMVIAIARRHAGV